MSRKREDHPAGPSWRGSAQFTNNYAPSSYNQDLETFLAERAARWNRYRVLADVVLANLPDGDVTDPEDVPRLVREMTGERGWITGICLHVQLSLAERRHAEANRQSPERNKRL